MPAKQKVKKNKDVYKTNNDEYGATVAVATVYFVILMMMLLRPLLIATLPNLFFFFVFYFPLFLLYLINFNSTFVNQLIHLFKVAKQIAKDKISSDLKMK